jgi:hypothetical protein
MIAVAVLVVVKHVYAEVMGKRVLVELETR